MVGQGQVGLEDGHDSSLRGGQVEAVTPGGGGMSVGGGGGTRPPHTGGHGDWVRRPGGRCISAGPVLIAAIRPHLWDRSGGDGGSP